MPYKDPMKQKEAQHQHYLNNKEAYNENHKAWKQRQTQFLREYKQTKSCEICGETRWQCLDFHHHEERVLNTKTKNNTRKTYGIPFLARRISRKRLLEEISKCRILCKNCHAMEHWDEEGNCFV